jgi:hypothetical protein
MDGQDRQDEMAEQEILNILSIPIKVTNAFTPEYHLDRMLGQRGQAFLSWSQKHSLRIDRFQKTCTQFVDDFKGPTGYSLGDRLLLQFPILSILFIHVQSLMGLPASRPAGAPCRAPSSERGTHT